MNNVYDSLYDARLRLVVRCTAKAGRMMPTAYSSIKMFCALTGPKRYIESLPGDRERLTKLEGPGSLYQG